MVHSAVQYRSAIKKNLRCCGNTKKRLLDKFDASLSVFLEDNPNATEVELVSAFGPAKVMAHVLMEDVNEQERSLYRKYKSLKQTMTIVSALILILLALYIFLIKEIPIEYTDELVENTTSQTEE